MQPHLPTPSASSSSLSLSLFPSASAVAYLPLRRSRLSLTKPRRDAAERGRARNSSSTPAKHLRPFPHNIYPSSFPLPCSLFLLQQLALVCLHMSPSPSSASASISVHTTLRLRGLCEISIWIFNFPFTVTRSQPLLLLAKHFA